MQVYRKHAAFSFSASHQCCLTKEKERALNDAGHILTPKCGMHRTELTLIRTMKNQLMQRNKGISCSPQAKYTTQQ
jgi:hypothetical protein